ncbi:sulfatase family protein [Halococcoides cellulosivorans]|uniref:Sulfatase n=1 Tax=Halococcoides cellulosivorans TaxID=1679096 RepID=A0A2R4X4K4_9EURY|nr:sulfatase [Halococcoides cellulosivorans]AWB28719.1 sulfatase [Halococcoides cellulosivorans]
MTDPQPNIVLIHCHDLGRYLGCYDYDVDTPAIESLADSGALFTEHYGTAPQCSPSRGSLMTGRYPHVNGLVGLAHGAWELDDGERILPHYLQDAGYETHMFGLQHITQDTDRLRYDRIHSEGNLYPGVSPVVHESNRARTVASVVSEWLESGAFDTPFFASVGFFELHRSQEADGRFGFDPDRYEKHDPDRIRPLPYLPDRRGIRTDLAEMHGMVTAIDDGVGEIVATLEDTGLDEETLVVFTTEHGIAFPRAKGSCYDAGLEVALILRYPGLADGGETYDELTSNVDVLPTLLELVGIDRPDAIDGRSFLSVLTDDEYTEREQVFAEMTWHDVYNPVRAIRTDQYKYIRSFWYLPKVYLTADVFASEAGREVREKYGAPGRPYEELYDLQETPQEDENVVHEPRYQDVRCDLSRRLKDWMVETNDPLLDGPVVPDDFDVIQRWPHEQE